MKNLDHIKSLTELLEVAVKDAKSISKDPNYIFDVDTWHLPINNGEQCAVCIAGAVIAKTLQIEKKRMVPPSIFNTRTNRLLRVLDAIMRSDNVDLIDYLSNSLNPNQHNYADLCEIIPRIYIGVEMQDLQRVSLSAWERVRDNARELKL